jgi:hypothetical protein
MAAAPARGFNFVMMVEAIENELAQAMMNAGRLTEAQALRRSELQREVNQLVKDFVARWS